MPGFLWVGDGRTGWEPPFDKTARPFWAPARCVGGVQPRAASWRANPDRIELRYWGSDL